MFARGVAFGGAGAMAWPRPAETMRGPWCGGADVKLGALGVVYSWAPDRDGDGYWLCDGGAELVMFDRPLFKGGYLSFLPRGRDSGRMTC